MATPARPKKMWLRYTLAGLIGYLANKLGPDAAGWMQDVVTTIMGY